MSERNFNYRQFAMSDIANIIERDIESDTQSVMIIS